MGKKKWTYWPFREHETGAMEEYLGRMAECGWHLTGFSRGGLQFEQGEPKRMRFLAAVLPGTTAFDGEDRAEIRELRERMAARGWQLVCGNYQWQIFTGEDGEDPSLEEQRGWLREIRKTVISLRRIWPVLVILLLLLSGFAAIVREPVRMLASRERLFGMALILFCVYSMLSDIFVPFFWCLRAERQLEETGRVQPASFRSVRRRGIGFAVLLLFAMGGVLVIYEVSVFIRVAVQLVSLGICWAILHHIREEDGGTWGEKMIAYLVGAFVVVFFISMLTNGIIERFL